MKKKILLVLLGLALVLVGCSNDSSQNLAEGKNVKIGIIQFSEHVSLDRTREGFLAQMEEEGYVVDADVVNVQMDMTLIPTTAAQFEGSNVDLVYAIATPVAQGIKTAIDDIPIVYAAVTDPEGAGLIGDNITGVSDYFPIEKQLEDFLKIFPGVKTIGVLYSIGEVNSEVQVEDLREVSQKLGLELEEVAVNTTNDVPQAMTSLVSKIDAYVQITDNLAASAAPVIANSLNEAGIPSYSADQGSVDGGILMSDSLDYFEQGREAGKIANQILTGTSPADIDIYYADQGSRIVHKGTAESLGIDLESEEFKDAELVE